MRCKEDVRLIITSEFFIHTKLSIARLEVVDKLSQVLHKRKSRADYVWDFDTEVKLHDTEQSIQPTEWESDVVETPAVQYD